MCTAEVKFYSNLDDGSKFTPNVETRASSDHVVFNATHLKQNHRYSVTVRAENTAGAATSHTIISRLIADIR